MDRNSVMTSRPATPATNEPVDDPDELTFEQQQEITKRLEGYRSNPSNSNKWRYDLFAYINEQLAQRDQQNKKKLLGLWPEKLSTNERNFRANSEFWKGDWNGFNRALSETRQIVERFYT